MNDATLSRRARLNDLAQALSLPLGDTQIDHLLAYLDLLQRWNATYNLTAIRDPEAMLTQHLADCLAIIAPLRRHLADRTQRRVLDVGSGGGLPGIVIAIMCADVDVTCVDTVGKKAAFIQQVSGSLRLTNLHSQHARVEQLKLARFAVITSRAFASLKDFVTLSGALLASDGGVWLAMKGKDPIEERADLPTSIEVFHVEQIQVPGLAAERCLVWMRPERSL